jgi:hypothetical protein
MTRWTFTYELIAGDGEILSRLTANHTDETVNEVAKRFIEFLGGCGFYPQDLADERGVEAAEVLQERIQAAHEYIDVMWNHQPTDRSAYRADLANLTAILEGNQEADE